MRNFQALPASERMILAIGRYTREQLWLPWLRRWLLIKQVRVSAWQNNVFIQLSWKSLVALLFLSFREERNILACRLQAKPSLCWRWILSHSIQSGLRALAAITLYMIHQLLMLLDEYVPIILQ